MHRAQQHIRDHQEGRLIAALWWIAAYLFVIVLTVWLARYMSPHGSPDLGWSD